MFQLVENSTKKLSALKAWKTIIQTRFFLAEMEGNIPPTTYEENRKEQVDETSIRNVQHNLKII